MEFTLTIKGSPSELGALLTQLKVPSAAPTIEAYADIDSGSTEIEAQFPNDLPAAPPAASNGKPKAATKPAAEKPKVAAPKPAPVKESVVATIEDEPVTLDMIRLASKAKLSKQAQIVEILAAHGATNMSTLDPEEYDAVYAKINDL